LNHPIPKTTNVHPKPPETEKLVEPDPSNASQPTSQRIRRELWLLLGVLMTALVHGLIYVILMPPWQHYEEPAHFEYAWMIADYAAGNRSEFPGYGDYDQEMRRNIASSMIEHDFFREIDFLPDLESEEPVWIGYGQAGTAPGLHILMALPLKLFAKSGVEVQLYAARLLSLTLYLLCIWFAYLITSEFVQPGNLLRLGVPLVMALHPGLVDLMTALNDDVGAIFVFSLFLLTGTRILKRGFTVGRLLALLGLAVVCFFTKVTVFVAIPLALLALILILFRRRGSPLLWLLPVAFIAAGIVLTMGWGDASKWYRQTDQSRTTRISVDNSPLGAHAFVLTGSSSSQSVLRQRIPEESLESLRGKVVTLGAWVWASEPLEMIPYVVLGLTHPQPLSLGPEPAFHAIHVEVPAAQNQLDILLQLAGTPEGISVYFDGVVLVEGERALDQAPVIQDEAGKGVVWGGVTLENHIRNASAEAAWPYVRPGIEKAFQDLTGSYLSPTILLGSVLNWENSTTLYRITGVSLFQTFWARFGWAHIYLNSSIYWALAGVTGLGVLGAILALWPSTKGKSRSWMLALGWLGLAAAVIWLSALLRGFFTTLDQRAYIPTARYAFPAMIPTMLVLVAGCKQVFGSRIGTVAIVLGYLVLDIASIVTIIKYYG